MGNISKELLEWKSKKHRGEIMKPETFENIAKKAGGGKKGQAIAGAAYWKTAKSKFKNG